jgi:two-component system, cell cycle response regulator
MASVRVPARRLRGTELSHLLGGPTAFAIVAALGVAVHGAFAVTGTSSAFVDNWLYCGLFIFAAASCAYRAWRGDARAAWAFAAIGVFLWGVAEIVFRLSVSDPTAWYPRSTQVLLFVAFAFAYTTLVLLARERVQQFDTVVVLDGLLAGLAAAAVAAVVLFPAHHAHHAPGPAAPPQVFLLASLVGLMFVVAVLGMTGWQPGPAWSLIAAAITVNVVGDAVLVHLADEGRFHRGSAADTLFVASALLLGLAAFHPTRQVTVASRAARRLPGPLLSAAAALAVLIVAAAHGARGLAVGLAAGALTVMIARMSIALELLERSRSQALTDDLTGLGNRRLLVRELERRLAPGRGNRPFTLALYDLDGFKRYNDTFGHLSGDALLMRLASQLAAAVSPGVAYRMGGDEFCTIVEGEGSLAQRTLAQAREALSESGDAFSITSSTGAVSCPEEAATVAAALRLADVRMYASKSGRTVDQIQTRDAVLTILDERDPGLYEHLRQVATTAVRVARRLGLDEMEAQQVERAAELHDIGKIALPDAILHKAGALDPDEERFMRQYPVIGERIARSAPSLAPVAPLVRSSQERWDGAGYPDGLRSTETPIGARIIGACDAYHAMRAAQPYRPAFTREQAIAELRRCAGTQFDPEVVRALCEELEDSAGE